MREWTPLVAKYIVRMKPIDNNPVLGLLTTSSIVAKANSFVAGGKMVDNNSSNVVCKFGIGIYGIIVNKTIIEGKNARKKLNAKEEALVVIDPSLIPL